MRLSFSISESQENPPHLPSASLIIIITSIIVTSAICIQTCLTISVSASDRSRLTAESGILIAPGARSQSQTQRTTHGAPIPTVTNNTHFLSPTQLPAPPASAHRLTGRTTSQKSSLCNFINGSYPLAPRAILALFLSATVLIAFATGKNFSTQLTTFWSIRPDCARSLESCSTVADPRTRGRLLLTRRRLPPRAAT